MLPIYFRYHDQYIKQGAFNQQVFALDVSRQTRFDVLPFRLFDVWFASLPFDVIYIPHVPAGTSSPPGHIDPPEGYIEHSLGNVYRANWFIPIRKLDCNKTVKLLSCALEKPGFCVYNRLI